MRLHPSVAFPLERIVPASGLALPDGSLVPAGCAVGINPYITLRNTTIFGSDADAFRPERWLQSPKEGAAAFDARVKAMRSVGDLVFGAGSRICLGRSLALMEIYKLVATLVARFE